ncbi:MAG: lactonase family protein [Verrucomicrobiota bacterium]
MLPKLIAPLFIITATLHATPVFIGTNTGGKSASKGIYLADFDAATGKLTEPKLAAEYQNPGFLALHPTKPILYACGQPSKPFADGTNSVAAFSIGTDHGLKFLGESSAGGKGACHVAVDATGHTVAVANYGDGSFATIKLGDDGSPGEIASVIHSKGSGPNKPRQDGPHSHGVYFDRANKHLFVPDLGLDQIFIYPFDAATSKLGDALPSLTGVPGAGPRHMTISPDEKNAYVINELANTVLATTYADGKFTALGTVPTLPADFTGGSTTAEIEVHPNGKFVYGSNRGHNSIVVYRRDPQSGALTFLQHAPCGGKTPRHFKIDPTGKWLLCAHQDSNTISVLPLDPATGLLGEPGGTVSSPSSICLLFGR